MHFPIPMLAATLTSTSPVKYSRAYSYYALISILNSKCCGI